MKVISRAAFIFLISTITSAYGDTHPTADKQIAPASNTTTISGHVMIQGKTPMTNGVVLLFDKSMGPPPSQDKYWRVPDLISGTDNRGRFLIEVSEGTYYLQVAQKDPDGEIGPPKKSEYFYFHADKGVPRPLIITTGTHLDLGTLTALEFTPDMVKHGKGVTAVEGVVTDQHGKPVEKAVVFAHLSKDAMGRPVFVSSRSDKEGRFELRVHEGTYYLKVRSVYGGGTPAEGEYLNVTDEFEPTMVSLKNEQKLKEVVLKVKRFSRPASTDMTPPLPPEKVWKNIGDLQGK